MKNLCSSLFILSVTLVAPVTSLAERSTGDISAMDSARPGLRSSYNPPQCSSLVSECFRLSGSQKTSCLYSASKHLFCSGGNLGELAYQRWTLASLPEVEKGTEVPAPHLVDRDCLEKFDNLFSSQLMGSNLSKTMIMELSDTLTQCVKKSSIELMRP